MMDDLENLLATGFRVSGNQSNTFAQHPRFSNYKYNYKSLVEEQKKRQEKSLERTKQKKFDLLSKLRNLPEEGEKDEESQFKIKTLTKNINQVKHKSIIRELRIKAMLSEWMLETPSNFEEDWLMMPVPIGKRCLVVAYRGGKTEVYNKGGQFMYNFNSQLCSVTSDKVIKNIILDCIYNEDLETFYVIDILSFNYHHLFHSEVEFRWFWMTSKFQEELQGVDKRTASNRYPFVLPVTIPCTHQTLSQFFSTPFTVYELDGLMFFHKKGHYDFKTSPLVLWLKTYMIEELLKIQVHQSFIKNVPSDYSGFKDHSEQIFLKKKPKNNPKKDEKEDTTNTKTENFENMQYEFSSN